MEKQKRLWWDYDRYRLNFLHNFYRSFLRSFILNLFLCMYPNLNLKFKINFGL